MRRLILVFVLGAIVGGCSGGDTVSGPTGPSSIPVNSVPTPPPTPTPVPAPSPGPPDWLAGLCAHNKGLVCRVIGWENGTVVVMFRNQSGSEEWANLTSYCLHGSLFSDQKTYDGGKSRTKLGPNEEAPLQVKLLPGKALQIDAYSGDFVETPPHNAAVLLGFARQQGEYCGPQQTPPSPPSPTPGPAPVPVPTPTPPNPPVPPVPPTPPTPPVPPPPAPPMGKLKINVAQGPGDGEVRWSANTGQSGVITGTGSPWLELPEGTVVSLKAVPLGTSRFDKWTGNPVCPSGQSGNVTVEGVNVLCTAHFKK